jgi:hypothetical protein
MLSVQYIPDWFPGAKFKRTAKEWRKTAEQLKHEPYNNIKDQVVRIKYIDLQATISPFVYFSPAV